MFNLDLIRYLLDIVRNGSCSGVQECPTFTKHNNVISWTVLFGVPLNLKIIIAAYSLVLLWERFTRVYIPIDTVYVYSSWTEVARGE